MPIVQESVEATYREMLHRLVDVVPDFELRCKAELVFEINRLKRQRNAIVLGHNYMEPALYHTVADHVGDSLELCRQARQTSADVIVFCGVRFMAETAKILNPDKTVLLPSLEAGCSLAASITAQDVLALKRHFPDVPVVSYVNTYAEVKAESDACCTSSNAAAVVESFGSDVVIFIPDEYLARNVARETGRRVVLAMPDSTCRPVAKRGERLIIGWPGRCEVHERFTTDDVRNVRRQFPGVVVLAHPECSPDVVQAADVSGSTSAMIRYVRSSTASHYLLLTECCMGDNIAAESSGKHMVRLCSVRCPHMNAITLQDTLAALQGGRHQIDVPSQIIQRAGRALERMLAAAPAGRHRQTDSSGSVPGASAGECYESKDCAGVEICAHTG